MTARLSDFDPAFSEFDELLERFAYDHCRNECAGPATKAWRDVDVEENEGSVRISFGIAGLDERAVAITIHDGVLTITLPKSDDREPRSQKVIGGPDQ